MGEDTHRLVPNRKLILGGVEIPYRMGLLGHSDADALVHAVIDALLGACAMGDIGTLFPDSDMQYKGISSLTLLYRVAKKLYNAGNSIVNIDSVITAQEPRLSGYIDSMRNNIANTLNRVDKRITVGSVSVKATTPEHTGAEGQLLCITCRAVAMCISSAVIK